MFGKLIRASVKMVQRYLPEPFVFAIILTLVSFFLAMPVCRQSPLEVLQNWGNGVWGLLAFSMQMALVLVCGSVLADTATVKKLLRRLAGLPRKPSSAIATVTLVSSAACWINWGFGLIVGVVFAEEIARQVKGVDYRLLIASAYSGFVVWHSGLSASIPLAMATPGPALTEVSRGYITEAIPLSGTIFAVYNVIIVLAVMAALTGVNACMHPKGKEVISVDPSLLEEPRIQEKGSPVCKTARKETAKQTAGGLREESVRKERAEEYGCSTPASRLENSTLLIYLICAMGLGYFFMKIIWQGGSLDLNSVILLFLFAGLLLHKTPIRYVQSLTRSASACAGILLQFPFYAGIMGIMTGMSADGVSLVGEISKACVNISNAATFPLLSFLSAGIVNIFVPSGGGQWAVQAPIMIPAGVQLGVSPAVTGMAIAWGDAWTNLIQPFWALPALAIARLNAKDIMGFCLIDLFVVGAIVCAGFLL